ncbi:MAG: glycosyltransferase family 4 protein [Methanosarcinaceae archaeon]
MKILMLNYEYPPLGGGGGVVTKALSEELVALGHSVDVVTMGFKGLKKMEIINGVTIYRVPCIRKKKEMCKTHEMLSYCISAVPFVDKLNKLNHYDINHTHFILPTGIVAYLLKNKLPYVITSHGTDVPGHNPDRFSFQHKLVNPIWKKVVNDAHLLIAPSTYLKDLILQNMVFNNVKVINNGCNVYSFGPIKKDKKVLLVSRLFEFKGFQHFLEAIKDININCEINIVGEGPYKDTLVNKSKMISNKVNFLGWVDNQTQTYNELFKTSSIFVHPSSAENCPVVLQEAMSSGCAIITTKNTGCAEIVGDTALLVKPNDPEEIRDALLCLINDDELMSELGHKARVRAENNFDWKIITIEYVNLYNDVLKSALKNV